MNLDASVKLVANTPREFIAFAVVLVGFALLSRHLKPGDLPGCSPHTIIAGTLAHIVFCSVDAGIGLAAACDCDGGACKPQDD